MKKCTLRRHGEQMRTGLLFVTVLLLFPAVSGSAFAATRAVSPGDGGARFLFFLSLAAVLGWYVYAWVRWGRDPKPGVIFPRFEPPANFTPAFTRYVERLEFDTAALSADILALALQGFLKIEDSSGTTFIRKNSSPPKDLESLASPHRMLLQVLFTDEIPELVLEPAPIFPGGYFRSVVDEVRIRDGALTGQHLSRLLLQMKNIYGLPSFSEKLLVPFLGRSRYAPEMQTIKPELTTWNIKPMLAGLLLLLPLYLCLSGIRSPLWSAANARLQVPLVFVGGLRLLLSMFTLPLALLLAPLSAAGAALGRRPPLAIAASILAVLSYFMSGAGIALFTEYVRTFRSPLFFLSTAVFHGVFVFLCCSLAVCFMKAANLRERFWVGVLALLTFALAGNITLSLFVAIPEDPSVAGGVFFVGIAVGVLAYLIPARTRAGRRLLDQVEGFRMYLQTAERRRLEFLYPSLKGSMPAESPELFERFLPYALALDAADTWAGTFAAELDSLNYSPSWYMDVRGIGAADSTTFSQKLSFQFAEGIKTALKAGAPGPGDRLFSFLRGRTKHSR